MKRSLVSLSALALAASTLTTVTFTVAVTTPAYGDHCDPAEQQNQNQQNQRSQQDPNRQNRNQSQQDQGQNQDQPAQDTPPQDQPAQDQLPQDAPPQDQPAQNQPDQDQPAQNQPAQDQLPQDRPADAPPAGGNLIQASPTEPATPDEFADQEAQTLGGNGNDSNARRRPNQAPSQNPDQPPADTPPTDAPPADPPANPAPGETSAPPPGGEEAECADLGPFPEDFIDIRRVPRNFQDVRTRRGGSGGVFTSRCGTNRNGHHNSDNFIVAPGVSNGAHHIHDYVGNLSTDAFSTDQSLAAAGTTCAFNDRSTYFWPVLRDRTSDANAGDPDGNVGTIMRARQVNLQFRGNPVSRVSPMPRFIRMLTGDAKAATNGGANALAKWTCTGFTNRITTKYPLCPRGSLLVRILDFPSCWDGQNNDSANHRTHVVFPDANGACPSGTRAIPQLRMSLFYATPRTASFALDAFPEQRHNPVTDHADFANVMPDRLMRFAVDCINRNRRC
ncbi:DUF1996 domain-containing protein [Streptosporangium sp. NPDC049304]|uniref:DUF1996 domain-containing protein n=1 Tax=Streptosporangium sp. NPDC049304 TaxID=3154830 RepID=UPI0034378A13